MIPERGRDDRERDLAGLGQEEDAVLTHCGRQRSPPLQEVRDQIAQGRGVEHSARERVGASLSRLLNHGDGEGSASLLLLQLGQPDRRGQPGRAATDDEHVDLEGLSLQSVQPFAIAATIAGAISNKSPTMP